MDGGESAIADDRIRIIMVDFFTCVGLSGSWTVVRKGGRPLLIFLALATCVGRLENLTA